MLVRFTHAEGGLVAKDPQAFTGFEIAAADGNFLPTNARIQGDGVAVRCPEVAVPAFVRCAWINDARAGLSNKEGLPLAPFRTDTFEK
jgi:sialate O-acetylesterase